MRDKKIKFLLIAIVILVFCSFAFVIIGINKKQNRFKKIERALENVFYYLPNSNYENLTDISDYCKISLIYGTDYIKSDYTIYDDGNKIKGYTKDNLLSSIKSILGDNSSINFEKDQNGEYRFLKQDSCMYNDKTSNLTYDEENGVVYNNSDNDNNSILVVDWIEEKEENKTIKLKANALIIVMSDKSYDLYIDNNMEHKIESYKSLNEAMSGAKENFDKSYIYNFELKLEHGNYIWTKYSNNSKIYEEEFIE